MNEKTKELFRSECEKDYKGRHFWKKMGVTRYDTGPIKLVWQCSQCEKCILEELEFLVSRSSKPKANKNG